MAKKHVVKWAKFPQKKGHYLPGWHHNETAKKRRAALRAAHRNEKLDWMNIFHKLNQLANVSQNQSPETTRIARADMKWIEREGLIEAQGMVAGVGRAVGRSRSRGRGAARGRRGAQGNMCLWGIGLALAGLVVWGAMPQKT